MIRLTLKSKALLLAMVPVLLFVLVLSGKAMLILRKQVDIKVKDTREHLLDDRRAELEHYVRITMGGTQTEYNRSANSDLNARAEAIAHLSKVRYGKGNYIFGCDSQVMHLFRGDSPMDVDRSFRNRRDPSGVYLNRELVEAGENGSRYVTHTSPLPGNESVMVLRLSYTLYLPKWDMVIGSAISLGGVEAQLVKIKQAIDEHIGTLTASIVAIAGVLLVVLLVTGLVVANAMLRSLHQIRQNLDDITAGEGNLTRRLPVTGHDGLGGLAGSFSRSVEKIHGPVRQIARITGDLEQLVEQMSAQAERLEQAMKHQRHEADQITTAINEMSVATHEAAQSAQRTAEAVQQTGHEGQAAERVVDGSTGHIYVLVDEIRDSGSSLNSLQRDMQSIVSVPGAIRSIAEQINLLAPNAAIETARAGGVGRGLTVVADEVRALASRTQQSTQEIQGIIDHLQQDTNAAVDAMRRSGEAGRDTSNQANQAGDSLGAIAQLIATISAMNAQIASAAEGQTAVAEETNRSVHQIAGAVDSVVDEAQQGAQTARSLAQLGQGLGRLVGQFRIRPFPWATAAGRRASRQWCATEPSCHYSAESAGGHE